MKPGNPIKGLTWRCGSGRTDTLGMVTVKLPFANRVRLEILGEWGSALELEFRGEWGSLIKGSVSIDIICLPPL